MKIGEIMECYRLCGGTFFTLITQAAYHKPTNSAIYTGEENVITEPKMLRDLFLIAIPSLNTLTKDDALNFKSCKTKTSRNLQTSNGMAGKKLQDRIKQDYNDCIIKMHAFKQKYIERTEWLIYALLELLDIDKTINDAQPFYISSDKTITKKALLKLEEINSSQFLLSIFIFVLTEIEDNTVGKRTYSEWCPASNIEHSRHGYQANIGDELKRNLIIDNELPNSESQVADTEFDTNNTTEDNRDEGIITFETDLKEKMHINEIETYVKADLYRALKNILKVCKDFQLHTSTLLRYEKYLLTAIEEQNEQLKASLIPKYENAYREVQQIFYDLFSHLGHLHTEFANIYEIAELTHTDFSNAYVTLYNEIGGQIAGSNTEQFIKKIKDMLEKNLLKK